MKRILLAILGFYRYWLSPAMHSLFPGGCRYEPTCSQYAVEAVTIHGPVRGSWMALRRLLRCHPFARIRNGGFDPVPFPGTPSSTRPVTIESGALHAAHLCNKRQD
ncbi:membrane protein insertion efficiency factor YidD [Acidicapsa ligni]|uniref:membrane protein insertion efficiency factor YidD n=1 Tax=Acidicapsa ligni TaxID=542300 RepID=UPI0021DF52D9|nr:membrane protein insertion efficiency factor YidD [Acidicapsa ligni]